MGVIIKVHPKFQVFLHHTTQQAAMKRITTIIAATLLCSAAIAQRTPQHAFDFESVGDAPGRKINWDEIYRFFDAWQPGTPPDSLRRIDDEFFISRQRPLQRIPNGGYSERSDTRADRKLFMWTPLDDPSTVWKALPRYSFEGDNFSMWQYVDCHGNWSAPWLRVAAGISDAAAKNGVSVGCLLSIPWAAKVGMDASDRYSLTLRKLTERNADGTFRNSLKLARLMKYYGINTLGINSEFYADKRLMKTLRQFFADLHKKARLIGWTVETAWYDITNDNGGMTVDKGLGKWNRRMFGSGKRVCADRLFANYNWTPEVLASSQRFAAKTGRGAYDYYAGFDIQGRGWKNKYWQALIDSDVSIGVWGAHAQNLLHQSATDDGTSDVAIQRAYLLKQELVFSGGNRNPAVLPAVRTDCTLANSDLASFHGLARLLTAKSTIRQVPFVTRFNLGNGRRLYKDGIVAFDSKWYNLGMQDYLPTWRFWITDENDCATPATLPSLVRAELSWDDAYTGGSSLLLHGATRFSRVKLFKTMLGVEPDYELSAVYKLNADTLSHARLFVALNGSATEYREIALPDANRTGEWTRFSAKLGSLGLKSGDEVAMIGVVVADADDDYSMNIGELALRNPKQRFDAVVPQVKEIQIMRGRYDSFDFKMRYASKEEKGGEKTYNDEVDTWYYEIYCQQKGMAPRLLTATESWAAYVAGAPLAIGKERSCRFGVRAVSPDGLQCSPIAWSEYRDVVYDTGDDAPLISRSVIRKGESFTIKYKDPLMPSARKWEIARAADGCVVAAADNADSITAAVGEDGVYDLLVIDRKGLTKRNVGFVQVTSEDTNRRRSRSCAIADPWMLSIPAAVQQGMEYTIALWLKADGWTHDKEGTNIIQKNAIADKWPYNNWGDLWVQVRPEWTGGEPRMRHVANELSFNTLGHADMDSPEPLMMSSGYSIMPGVWTHIAVVQDKQKQQRMYINGRLVAGPFCAAYSSRRDSIAAENKKICVESPANLYIGGGGVYKAALNGCVDDVQIWSKALSDEEVRRCMKGFEDDEVADELKGYYTFDDDSCGGSVYRNHGSLSGYDASLVRIVNGGGEDTQGARYEMKN